MSILSIRYLSSLTFYKNQSLKIVSIFISVFWMRLSTCVGIEESVTDSSPRRNLTPTPHLPFLRSRCQSGNGFDPKYHDRQRDETVVRVIYFCQTIWSPGLEESERYSFTLPEKRMTKWFIYMGGLNTDSI